MNAGGVAADLIAHRACQVGQLALELLPGNAGAGQHSAKDAEVGIAMDGHAIDRALDAEKGAQRVAEGVVVDAVARVQQGAVNVEQVGVCFPPAKRRCGGARWFHSILGGLTGSHPGGRES
ncbi:MAG: hypothetical protein ACXVY9_10480 [Terriglobales bacterium]